MINFLATITYLIVGKNILKGGSQQIADRFIFWLLALISAYALNRNIPVFEASATWLGVLLVLVGMAYLLAPHMARLPVWLRQAVMFVIGVGVLLWIYLSIYLTPIYGISVIAIPGLAFSLHSFVPIALLVVTVRWLTGFLSSDKKLVIGLGTGMLSALIIVTAFCLQWSGLEKLAAEDYRQSLIDDNTDLPSWVKVARHLPDTWATEKFLKEDLIYSTVSASDFVFWDIPSLNLNEVRKHDPLVMIASLFTYGQHLGREDRIRILEAKYDARHKTEERLWSGTHLHTTSVITNASIWPALHLAYTEQIITVANEKYRNSWVQEEEAIYTFHLPEGSAVTSLSLWIDGRESKAILTTKGKADSAYKQIVGKERRDPSVVHWAEGNRISVRVFPVMADGNRVFKIGITTPMIVQDGRLTYQPAKFEGPPSDDASATTQLSIQGPITGQKGLDGFDRDERGRYKRAGSYDGDWQLSFKAPPLTPASFSFNGNTYSLQPYQPQRVPAVTESIYMDLNKSWTRAEFNAVYELAKGRKLYACTDEVVEINDDNKEAVFTAGQKAEFSLFPLFSITAPEQAILITRSTPRSPNIKDLTGSGFAEKLEIGLKGISQIKLFHLGGGQLSPYLKTLKEHRAFRYERGTPEDLRGLLTQNVFAAFPETDSSIVIDDAGMRITKATGARAGSGPDHLQRLFACNHIIQHLGKSLYTNMEGNPALVKEATEAYVVSPISSLVVLETAADYDRFGIKDDAASLKNASVKSHGAVPEPHEWALIILAVAMLVWTCFRRYPVLFNAGRR